MASTLWIDTDYCDPAQPTYLPHGYDLSTAQPADDESDDADVVESAAAVSFANMSDCVVLTGSVESLRRVLTRALAALPDQDADQIPAERAVDAFWRSVAASFPSATTGDMSPPAVLAFEEAARVAVAAWYGANVLPEEQPTDDELAEQYNAYVEDSNDQDDAADLPPFDLVESLGFDGTQRENGPVTWRDVAERLAEQRAEQETVWRVTRGDLADVAGHPVTDVEAARVAKAMEHSSIPDALSEVVAASLDH